MKGLVLAGGKGTRLRPLTYTGAKQLVPIANKPVLFYAIENLVDAGIEEIGIIVGDTQDQVRAAVGDGSRWGARVTYIEQDQPLGIAHAVKIAQSFVGDDRFVLFLGDNFIREGITPLVDAFRRGEANCGIILYKVPNPQDFGVAMLEGQRVVRLVEKPKEAVSDLAVIGIYFFDPHVFEAVNAIQPSRRGELEITDTIQYLIDRGCVVDAHRLDSVWIDTGKMEDILEANRLILERLEQRIDGRVDAASKIEGRVVVEQGAEVVNSVIRGPAVIGERTKIVDSYVGPFSSIDHDCVVQGAEVEHSIVLDNSQILDVETRIDESLIGRNVRIHRAQMRPRAYKLMLGDYSKLSIR